MTRKHPAGVATSLRWVKSSYSSNDGPDCVEVAATPDTIHIRDSKDTALPHLTASHTAWTNFLTQATKR